MGYLPSGNWEVRTGGIYSLLGIGKYGAGDLLLLDDLDANSTYKLINLPAPTADNDAARKKYVDDMTWDHGTQVTGLGDDDHTQYLLVSGSRAMAGDLNMNNKDINAIKNATIFDDLIFDEPLEGTNISGDNFLIDSYTVVNNSVYYLEAVVTLIDIATGEGSTIKLAGGFKVNAAGAIAQLTDTVNGYDSGLAGISVDKAFDASDGSANAVFNIATANTVKVLSNRINADANTYGNCHFTLVTHIVKPA